MVRRARAGGLQSLQSSGIHPQSLFQALYEHLSLSLSEQVSQARRNGDVDPDTAMIAEKMKLLGNSAYGKYNTK